MSEETRKPEAELWMSPSDFRPVDAQRLELLLEKAARAAVLKEELAQLEAAIPYSEVTLRFTSGGSLNERREMLNAEMLREVIILGRGHAIADRHRELIELLRQTAHDAIPVEVAAHAV
ncbi:MAG: hypothetical protein AB7O62_00300 [Pirellulales bacterium]